MMTSLSSVSGYLQVLSVEPLNFLPSDIRSLFCSKQSENETHIGRMPALWPNLEDILNLESSVYLPQDVSNIILKLIFIRKNTLSNSAVRAQGDYVEWEIGKSGDIPRNILSGM